MSLLRGLRRNHYRVVLADPPWHFKSYSQPDETTPNRRDAEQHYETMDIDSIAELPVADYCAKDCHLFLWVTGPMLELSFQVIQDWGFKFSGVAFTWVKLKRHHGPMLFDHNFHVGLGFTTRKNTELCLLARRGNPKRISNEVRELIISPVRQHSRKPDEVHDRIECYADGPYLELFGRSRRRGWTVRGNQTNHFKENRSNVRQSYSVGV